MELWDVYDENRNKTGRLHQRGIPMPEGDYHLVVHAWIVNDDKEVLIQKRAANKVGYPNMWDCSAAGSAITGDSSLDAVVREVKEEIGIDVDMSNSEVLFTINFSRGFDDIWFIRQNVDINTVVLQVEEVSDARWATMEEIKEMIERDEFINHSYMDELYEIINDKS